MDQPKSSSSEQDFQLNDWTEFERRATAFLQSIANGNDIYRLREMSLRLTGYQDQNGDRHNVRNNATFCPILIAQVARDHNEVGPDSALSKDEIILSEVQNDIMMLYDPCVVERIWKADRHADREFLSKLADAIKEVITQAPITRGYSQLRLFLSELNELGAVDLSESPEGKALEKDIDDNEYKLTEWRRAFEIVKKLLEEPTPLESLCEKEQFSNSYQFRREYFHYFMSEKSEGYRNTLVKYENPDRSSIRDCSSILEMASEEQFVGVPRPKV